MSDPDDLRGNGASVAGMTIGIAFTLGLTRWRKMRSAK